MNEAAVLRAALRHDMLSAPIGFVLLGLGLAAGMLALARRRSGDPWSSGHRWIVKVTVSV